MLPLVVLMIRSTGYKVLEIDVMMDDGARKVVSLHERGQLSPEDVPQGAAALCK